MKRLCALALVGLFACGLTLTGCSKPPAEKPAVATTTPQAEPVKHSPAKGSMTDSAGP